MTLERSVLDSGLVVITDFREHSSTTSVVVAIAAGSRDETKAECGAAHAAEHVFSRVSTRNQSGDSLWKIQRAGGEVVASTTKEVTSYLVRVDSDLAMEGLTSILRRLEEPVVHETEFAAERVLIAAELRGRQDDKIFRLIQSAESELFAHSSLANSADDELDALSRLNIATVEHFVRAHYRASRMVVASSGALSHDLVSAICADVKMSHKNGDPERRSQVSKPTASIGGVKDEKRAGISQAHLLAATPLDINNQEVHTASQLVNVISGGGPTSTLTRKLRSHVSSYAGTSFLTKFSDAALFAAYITSPTDVASIEHAAKSLHGLSRTSLNDLDDTVLMGAVDLVVGRSRLAQESSAVRVRRLVDSEFAGYAPELEITRERALLSIPLVAPLLTKLAETPQTLIRLLPVNIDY